MKSIFQTSHFKRDVKHLKKGGKDLNKLGAVLRTLCENGLLPIPQWQKDELDRRKRHYRENPDSGRTWGQVKQDILQPQ